MMLKMESKIVTAVERNEDSLKCALQYSMTGNYIDFGSMNVVDEDYLQKLLDTVSERPINEAVYENMCKDLVEAHKLVFITDNCGEIVLDKVLIKTIIC